MKRMKDDGDIVCVCGHPQGIEGRTDVDWLDDEEEDGDDTVSW